MLPLRQLPEVFGDPLFIGVLTLVVGVLYHYQRGLNWYEYRAIHRLKVRVLPYIDRRTNAFVVSRKGGPDDPEHLATVADSPRGVFKTLVASGGVPHLICSIKLREHPKGEGMQYSVAHVVWRHEDGDQTEAYLFALDDKHVDVYAHHETGVMDAYGHLTDPQEDGDPHGVVQGALFGGE